MSFRLWCAGLLLVTLCASGCCWCRHHGHHCGYQGTVIVSPAAASSR